MQWLKYRLIDHWYLHSNWRYVEVTPWYLPEDTTKNDLNVIELIHDDCDYYPSAKEIEIQIINLDQDIPYDDIIGLLKHYQVVLGNVNDDMIHVIDLCNRLVGKISL